MKLLQLNAWGGRLEKQIVQLLKEQSADLVCLQEAISTKGDGALSVTVEQLQKYANYGHAYCSPVFSFHLMNKDALFGNAILSRLPLATAETIFTNQQFKADFDFDSDDYNIRNFQHVTFNLGNHTLHVLNHHGHHIHQHKNGDEQTLRQMNQIAQYILKLEGPIILTGDFNLEPESSSIGVINLILRNLSSEYGLKTTRTQFTPKMEVCDYIFVSDEVKVSDFKALDDLVSDHKALILEFEI